MPSKENTSLIDQNKELLDVFQSQFTGFLNLARIRLICLFISSLCKVKSVNFAKLSSGFDTQSKASSNFRRIQRFISQVQLPMMWISKIIFSLLPEKNNLVLILDRTNWKFGDKNINILMLGVS